MTTRIPISSRVDLLSLATVARWLAVNGIVCRSLSDLVNTAVTQLATQIEEAVPEDLSFDDVDEALEYLEGLGIEINRDRKTKVGRKILHLQLGDPIIEPGSEEAALRESMRAALARLENQDEETS